MEFKTKSIRPFIGAKNFKISRQFYDDFGFEEVILETKMSLFKAGSFGFYLQDYYAKDWIDNSMIFLEVENLESHLLNIKNLELIKSMKAFG
ncbi:MAG: glyoxalase [Leeuwenhoekiella sp.]